MSNETITPSQQARRAAEAIKSCGLYCPIPSNTLEEIIERETGVGEAMNIIRRLLIALDQLHRDGSISRPSTPYEARAFLAKNQPI